uniref:SJCHGC03631 protein n=1 Tax=Schistosoma japonicum TaxID=6182 RepID=Q5DD46_SCHJA|nr:SJCHGC03631 protein [Schistosoma japonicum]
MSPVALHYLNVLIFLLLSPSILAEPPKEWVSQLKEEVTNNLDKINRYQKEVNNSKDTLKQRLGEVISKHPNDKQLIKDYLECIEDCLMGWVGLSETTKVTNEANNIMNEYGITEEIRALPWQTYLGIYNIIYRVKKAKCKQKNCERLTENKQNDLNVVQHFQQEAIKSQVRLNSCILINNVLRYITGTLNITTKSNSVMSMFNINTTQLL